MEPVLENLIDDIEVLRTRPLLFGLALGAFRCHRRFGTTHSS